MLEIFQPASKLLSNDLADNRHRVYNGPRGIGAGRPQY